MKEITGDIFSLHGNPDQIVWKICPTNGYVTKDNKAVMGAGIAKDLAQEYPKIPSILGTLLEFGGNIPYLIMIEGNTYWFSFPVKHSWNEPADPNLILNSLVRFKRALYEREETRKPDFVVFPRVGCGNGKLNWNHTVRPMMLDAFGEDDRVVTVSLPF